MKHQNSRHDRLRPLRRRGALTGAVLLVAGGLAACGTAQTASVASGGIVGLVSTVDGLTAEDGVIADNAPVSIFDADLPAIAKLDPGLRAAVEAAAAASEADGVEMVVTSGWRSSGYQQSLLDDAVHEYGSYAEARRWVSTPELSAHVTGDAIDIGYTDANSWLSQHGADYGLCQTYSNEMWHFELATEPGGDCPEQKQDANQ